VGPLFVAPGAVGKITCDERIQMESINADGDWCAVKEMEYKISANRVCRYCRATFGIGDKIVLLINNWKIFPNSMVHRKCVDKMGGMEACVRELKARYTTATELRKEAEKLWCT
jgi:hypothetical protein